MGWLSNAIQTAKPFADAIVDFSPTGMLIDIIGNRSSYNPVTKMINNYLRGDTSADSSASDVMNDIADSFHNSISGIMNDKNNQLLMNNALQLQSYQTQSAERAMQFNAEQAQLNRDWQERMSNTSYQRAVSDLKSAGLNPVLAYTNGGASTPAGSSASGYAMSGAMADVDTNNHSAEMINALGSIVSGLASAVVSAVAKAYASK